MKESGQIRLSKNLSRAVSSIKMKAGADGVDVDLKLHDKLKAIELYFKICGVSENEDAEEGGIYVNYSYVSSPQGRDG